MKEKKKRKILAALIPVAVLFLAAVVFAHGVLKSEPEAVPNPVQGISADSSLKGYLGTGFAYAGSKNDGNGEEMAEQQEQAQLLPEETPTPTVTPEPTKEPVMQTVTPTPEPEESVTPTPQATVTETPPENNNNTNQNQENQSNTIEYDNQDDPDDSEQPSETPDADDNRNQERPNRFFEGCPNSLAGEFKSVSVVAVLLTVTNCDNDQSQTADNARQEACHEHRTDGSPCGYTVHNHRNTWRDNRSQTTRCRYECHGPTLFVAHFDHRRNHDGTYRSYRCRCRAGNRAEEQAGNNRYDCQSTGKVSDQRIKESD